MSPTTDTPLPFENRQREAERKEIAIVSRDMSKAEKESLNQHQQFLIDLLGALESGETFGYSEDVVNKLAELLNRKKKRGDSIFGNRFMATILESF